MTDFMSIFEAIRDYTIVPPDRCQILYRLSRYASLLDGDIAELGTYRGGTSLLLARTNPGKQVHSFDTFCGIPNGDPRYDRHRTGDFADVDDQVIERLEIAGIKVHQGVFPTTTQSVDGPFCFAHFDADTYQSCKDFLQFFWPRMVNGGIMLFDDWEWPMCPGVKQAILEHCDSSGAWPFQTNKFQAAISVARPNA